MLEQRIARVHRLEGDFAAPAVMGTPQVEEPAALQAAADPSETPQPQNRGARVAAPQIPAPAHSTDGDAAARDAWRDLIDAGLNAVARLLDAAQAPPADDAVAAHPLLETDPATGRRYLRLPIPDPDTLTRLAEVVSRFVPRSDSG